MIKNIDKIKKAAVKPEILAELVYILFFIGSILVKCFYFQFTTQINNRPFSAAINVIMLTATFGVVLILTAITLLVFNKRRKAALLAVDFLLSLILLADTLYFRYYYNAISVPVLAQIGLVGSVGGSILNLSRVKDLVYIIDFPVLAAGLFFMRRFGTLRVGFVKRLAVTVLAAAVGFGIFQFAYRRADTTTFDNNYIIKNLGIFYFHTFDVKRFASENLFTNKSLSKEDVENITNYFENKKAAGGEKLKGIAKGKNLIIIQVEALQNFVIGSKINGVEITPNLNKLAEESLYFKNFYYQVAGGNTSDAEFLCNASLYPAKEGAVYFRYATNTYFTLPKTLKAQGYTSYVSHAYMPSFWNRTEAYKAIGFDRFFSSNDFVLDELVGWGGWALSDSSFFRQTMKKIDTNKPFYGFFITLSSHHPFSYFENSKDFNVGDFEKTYLGNYLKAAHYADACIGEFVRKLKNSGLFDNTVLVLYGDHSAVPKTQSADLFKFLGIPYSELEWAKQQKVPLLLHYPGLDKGQVIDTTGGEIDIFPTVANLMDIEAPYAMGKDLLNTDKGYAVLRTGSFSTDDMTYLSWTDKAYKLSDSTELRKEAYEKELDFAKNELYISDLILKKDALKKLYKEQK